MQEWWGQRAMVSSRLMIGLAFAGLALTDPVANAPAKAAERALPPPIGDAAQVEWRTPPAIGATDAQRAAADAAISALAGIEPGTGLAEAEEESIRSFRFTFDYMDTHYRSRECDGPLSSALDTAYWLDGAGQPGPALAALDILDERLEALPVSQCKDFFAMLLETVRIDLGPWPPAGTLAVASAKDPEGAIRAISIARAAIRRNDLPTAMRLIDEHRPVTDDLDINRVVADALADQGRLTDAMAVFQSGDQQECFRQRGRLARQLFDLMTASGRLEEAALLLRRAGDQCFETMLRSGLDLRPVGQGEGSAALIGALQERFDLWLPIRRRCLEQSRCHEPLDIAYAMARLGYVREAMVANARLAEASVGPAAANPAPSYGAADDPPEAPHGVPASFLFRAAMAAGQTDLAAELRPTAEASLTGASDWSNMAASIVAATAAGTTVLLPARPSGMDDEAFDLAHAWLAGRLSPASLRDHPEVRALIELRTRGLSASTRFVDRIDRALRGGSDLSRLVVARYLVGDLPSALGLLRRASDPVVATELYILATVAGSQSDEPALRQITELASARLARVPRNSSRGRTEDRDVFTGGYCASIAMAAGLPQSQWADAILLAPALDRDPLADRCRIDAARARAAAGQAEAGQALVMAVRDAGWRALGFAALAGPQRITPAEQWREAVEARRTAVRTALTAVQR